LIDHDGYTSDINVEFVNVDTDKVFATSDVPAENLPDTFALNTTMHLGAEDWEVVSANPIQKNEFLKTHKLRLVLRKVMMIDPKKVFFTLPSLCDYLGETTSQPKTGKELEIHEDSWRNIEIISPKFENEIDSDLREIFQVHQEESVGAGFKKLVVREKIEFPLSPITIPFTEVENLFRIDKSYSGLGYEKSSGIVKDGFAFQTQGGIIFYGRKQKNNLRELCVAGCEPNGKIAEDVNALELLMSKYNLYFVDWCRVFKETSEGKNLERYFTEVFGKQAAGDSER
jgi:hypothetical protein